MNEPEIINPEKVFRSMPFRFTQGVVNETGEKLVALLKNAGAPYEDVTEIEMELHGGNCPWCSRPWKLVKASGDVTKKQKVWDKEARAWKMEAKTTIGYFGQFEYYAPICYCYQKDRAVREKGVAQINYLEAKLIEAKIPKSEWKSDFSNWDYGVNPDLNNAMKACLAWAESDAWSGGLGLGLMLCGAVGTGKTRCTVMLARYIMERDPEIRVRFLPMSDLLTCIIKDQTNGGYLESLLDNQIIIVDDMDKVPADKEWARSQVFSFYDMCLREGVSLIGTTNLKGPDEMVEKFEYAVVSRIMGNCKFVKFDGQRADDYRLIRRKYEKGGK